MLVSNHVPGTLLVEAGLTYPMLLVKCLGTVALLAFGFVYILNEILVLPQDHFESKGFPTL